MWIKQQQKNKCMSKYKRENKKNKRYNKKINKTSYTSTYRTSLQRTTVRATNRKGWHYTVIKSCGGSSFMGSTTFLIKIHFFRLDHLSQQCTVGQSEQPAPVPTVKTDPSCATVDWTVLVGKCMLINKNMSCLHSCTSDCCKIPAAFCDYITARQSRWIHTTAEEPLDVGLNVDCIPWLFREKWCRQVCGRYWEKKGLKRSSTKLFSKMCLE